MAALVRFPENLNIILLFLNFKVFLLYFLKFKVFLLYILNNNNNEIEIVSIFKKRTVKTTK